MTRVTHAISKKALGSQAGQKCVLHFCAPFAEIARLPGKIEENCEPLNNSNRSTGFEEFEDA